MTDAELSERMLRCLEEARRILRIEYHTEEYVKSYKEDVEWYKAHAYDYSDMNGGHGHLLPPRFNPPGWNKSEETKIACSLFDAGWGQRVEEKVDK